jgi:hypothetical protein
VATFSDVPRDLITLWEGVAYQTGSEYSESSVSPPLPEHELRNNATTAIVGGGAADHVGRGNYNAAPRDNAENIESLDSMGEPSESPFANPWENGIG